MKTKRLLATILIVGLIPSLSVLHAQTNSDGDNAPWKAPSRAARKANPIPADLVSKEAGKANYEVACLVCHGTTGKGDGSAAAALERKPGNLADSSLWLQSDGELFWKIGNGSNPMPPFSELFSDEQIWEIVNYVRTLAPEPEGGVPSFTPEVIASVAEPEVEMPGVNVITASSGDGSEFISRAEYENLLKQFESLQRQMGQIAKKAETEELELEESLDELDTQIQGVKKDADAVRSGSTKQLVAGFATTGFTDINGQDSSFSAGFNPLFHWKPSERLLLTGELEVGLQGSETELALDYAHLSYIANDYMTVGAGKFLTPFGTFTERLHPAWINKLPDSPLSAGHGGIAPASSLGIQLRGGFAAGPSKFNWATYVSNGPKLNVGEGVALLAGDASGLGGGAGAADGHDEGDQAEGGQAVDDHNDDELAAASLRKAGLRRASVASASAEADAHGNAELGALDFENYDSFGENKAFGGRVGFLPLPEVELGYSFFFARVDASGTSMDQLNAYLHAVDLSYVRDSERLKGILDIRLQWNWSAVEDATYFTDDGSLSFENSRQGGYAQLAYRPSKIDSVYLKNCEIVGRWDTLELPSGFPGGVDQERWTIGLNYWFGPSTVAKVAYQFGDQEAADGDKTSIDGVLLQAAMGF